MFTSVRKLMTQILSAVLYNCNFCDKTYFKFNFSLQVPNSLDKSNCLILKSFHHIYTLSDVCLSTRLEGSSNCRPESVAPFIRWWIWFQAPASSDGRNGGSWTDPGL